MSDYYDATVVTIMVPVKVRYHDATDVVYSFDPPTTDDVSNAISSRNLTKEGLDELKQLIIDLKDVQYYKYIGTLLRLW